MCKEKVERERESLANKITWRGLLSKLCRLESDSIESLFVCLFVFRGTCQLGFLWKIRIGLGNKFAAACIAVIIISIMYQ